MPNEIVELLDRELEDARHEAQRHGWTFWAVLLTTASLAWIIIGTLENQPDLHTSARLLLCGIFTGHAVVWLVSLATGDDDEQGPIRYRLGRGFGAFRSELLVALLGDALIIVCALNLYGSVPNLAVTGSLLLSGFSILRSLSIFVVTFTSLPIPKTANKRIKNSFGAFGIIMSIINGLIAFYYWPTQLTFSNFPANEVRLAGAAWGLYILLPLLTQARRSNPLVDALRRIRRDVMLGSIPATEAARETEIVLRGLRASDVLQQEIGSLVAAVEKARLALVAHKGDVNAYYRITEQANASIGDVVVSTMYLDEGRVVREALRKKEEALLELHRDIQKRIKRLGEKSSAMIIFNPSAAEELSILADLLVHPFNEMRDEAALIAQQRAAADEQLKRVAVESPTAP